MLKISLRYAVNRLREPSTLAGLAGLAIMFGVDATKTTAALDALAAILAAGAVFLPEKKA